MKRTMRTLPVKLNTEQVAELGTELAQLEEERAAIRLTMSNEAAAHREELKPISDRIREVSKILCKREREEPVECEESDGLVNGALEVRRLDTNEIVTVEPTPEDRQPSLPLEGAGKAKGKSKAKKGATEGLEPDHAACAKGTGGRFRGADGEEHDLDAELADAFRLGQTVTVQSVTMGRPVEIVQEIKPPKKKAPKGSNGASAGAAT